MEVKYLLDSTALIDYMNGIKPAIAWISGLSPGEACVSVVTRAEVLTKAVKDWELVSHFLDEYDCLPVGPEDADIAAGLRANYRIKLPDAFQAALAQNHELTLITRDTTDFKKIPHLRYKTPYKI